MKNWITMRAKSSARRRRPWGRFIVCAALATFALRIQAAAPQSSPAEGIKHFFNLLVKRQVQQAADVAVFSDEEARKRFSREWTEKAQSLSGYRIEEWEIEAKKGWADVALEPRGSEGKRSIKVGLVKLDGTWKVVPQEDFDFNPPTSALPPEIENLEDFVDVTSDKKGRRIELSVVNKAPFSLLFRFDMKLPSVLRPDCSLPLLGILSPGENPVPLCSLRIAGRSSYKYSWRYSVKRADDCGETVEGGGLRLFPEVSISEDPKLFVGEKYAYGLPYPAGQAYLIWQGPGGEFSHSEPGSRYAVDFAMPLGSEIAAARAGMVVGVVQKNPDNPDENPAPRYMANEILILHTDGTIGVYAHLTTDGAKVSEGQAVRRGQVIGLSGNSGYSRGPHLHFDVLGYKASPDSVNGELQPGGTGSRDPNSASDADEEGQCVSIPFDFLSSGGGVITPREDIILLSERDGAARIAKKESRPWRVLHKWYERYDTEIHYFGKSIEFLAANKMDELLGLELSFSRLENAVTADKLPRRVALPADGAFHQVLTLQLVNPGQRSSFAYIFRRVEPPGMEHIPLRVERDAADGYVVEIRHFSDRIEFYAENKTSRPMAGSLDFPSLTNVAPREKMPRKILLPADASAHYLATLRIVQPTKGHSFRYDIGPGSGR